MLFPVLLLPVGLQSADLSMFSMQGEEEEMKKEEGEEQEKEEREAG